MPNELCKTYSPLPAVPHDCYGRILANTFCTADRKSTRLNSSHDQISYAVFCLKKKKNVKNLGAGRKHRIPYDNHKATSYAHHQTHDGCAPDDQSHCQRLLE